jgi:hypothetical protein
MDAAQETEGCAEEHDDDAPAYAVERGGKGRFPFKGEAAEKPLAGIGFDIRGHVLRGVKAGEKDGLYVGLDARVMANPWADSIYTASRASMRRRSD